MATSATDGAGAMSATDGAGAGTAGAGADTGEGLAPDRERPTASIILSTSSTIGAPTTGA
ncbi:hypothetical protein EBT31_22805 [bacterium]|nr:hypothetical protein [bacterium]